MGLNQKKKKKVNIMALWQSFPGPSQSLWKLMEILYWIQPTYICEIEVCHSQVVTNAFFLWVVKV